MEKKEFITRLILFLLFSLVVPISYISIRCQLWTQKTTISFWFILLVIIVIGVVAVLIKYYLDGMKTKYSMVKQILTGVIRVILPIGIVLLLAIWYKGRAEWIVNHTNLFIEIVSIILVSEAIAIVVNPLPKWAFENNVDGLVEITDRILHKDETGGGE